LSIQELGVGSEAFVDLACDGTARRSDDAVPPEVN
jgi:hypothetical protein